MWERQARCLFPQGAVVGYADVAVAFEEDSDGSAWTGRGAKAQ